MKEFDREKYCSALPANENRIKWIETFFYPNAYFK